MKLKIYTVYDSKMEAYLQPFFMHAKGQAIRTFSDMINDPQHNFHKHSEDFTLFELGTYEDSTAEITPYPTPISLGLALEFKNKGV